MADDLGKISIKTRTTEEIKEGVQKTPATGQPTPTGGPVGGNQAQTGGTPTPAPVNPNDPSAPIQPPLQQPAGGGAPANNDTQAAGSPNQPGQQPANPNNQAGAQNQNPNRANPQANNNPNGTNPPGGQNPPMGVPPAEAINQGEPNAAGAENPADAPTNPANPDKTPGKTANRNRNKPGEPAKPIVGADGGKTAIRPRAPVGAASGAGGKVAAAANVLKDPKAAVKQVTTDVVKKAVFEAIKQAVSTVVNAVVGFFGWWCLLGCAIVFIICLLIGIMMFALASDGQFGKTYPSPSGAESADAKGLIADSQVRVASGETNYYKFEFLNSRDKEYVEQGKADKRLLNAIEYLVGKHKRIAVSHFVSTYEDMPNNPEAGDQLAKNVSAHAEGLAADVTEIDFVYKVFKPNADCSIASYGALGDLYFYNDIDTDKELYKGHCQAIHKSGLLAMIPDDNIPYVVSENTTMADGTSAEAVPIKVCWHDPKPDNKHLDLEDVVACTTQPSKLYDDVFQPEARRKTHQVLDELLDYPYTTPAPDDYKVTQLITYSEERDVTPFKAKIDKLYGLNKEINIGLFAMVEAWTQVHLGY